MKPYYRHKWTDGERDIVRRDYDGTNKSAWIIANKLDVTFCAVKGQVQRMGIAQDKSPNWTESEIEILTKNITRYSTVTIARKLHRSINSVVLKAKRLGLSRRIRDDWYTKRDVCNILGVDHKKIQHWIDWGELKASYHHGYRPQKNGSGSWHVDKSHLRAFIISHSVELTGRNVDLFLVLQVLL